MANYRFSATHRPLLVGLATHAAVPRQPMARRQRLLALRYLLIISAIVGGSIFAGCEPPLANRNVALEKKRAGGVNWRLLSFGAERRITKLRFVVPGIIEERFREPDFDHPVGVLETTDPDVLDLVRVALETSIRRAPEKDGHGGSGAWPLLRLTIFTSDGESFYIFVGMGFGLNEPFVHDKNTFHSFILARVVDSAYFQISGERIPAHVGRVLSGKVWEDSQMDILERHGVTGMITIPAAK